MQCNAVQYSTAGPYALAAACCSSNRPRITTLPSSSSDLHASPHHIIEYYITLYEPRLRLRGRAMRHRRRKYHKKYSIVAGGGASAGSHGWTAMRPRDIFD
eukprot:4488795-Pyramimonas_sp.AAC.1